MKPETVSAKKPRRKRSNKTMSWAAAFDKKEQKMLKSLKRASGNVLSVSEIQRAAVRFAVPKFLSGEVPVTNGLTITPRKPQEV